MYKIHPKTIFWLTAATLVFTPVLANALDLSGIEPSTSPESDFIHNSDINSLGNIQNILCSGLDPAEMAGCMTDLAESNITAPQGVNPEVESATSTASSDGSSGGSSGETSSGGPSGLSSGESSGSSIGDSSSSTVLSSEESTTPTTDPLVTTTETTQTEPAVTTTTETTAPVETTPVVGMVPTPISQPAVTSVETISPALIPTPAVVAEVKKNIPKVKEVETEDTKETEKLSPAAEVEAKPATANNSYQTNLLLATPVVKASQAPAILTTLFFTFLALQVGFLAFCAIRNSR